MFIIHYCNLNIIKEIISDVNLSALYLIRSAFFPTHMCFRWIIHKNGYGLLYNIYKLPHSFIVPAIQWPYSCHWSIDRYPKMEELLLPLDHSLLAWSCDHIPHQCPLASGSHPRWCRSSPQEPFPPQSRQECPPGYSASYWLFLARMGLPA